MADVRHIGGAIRFEKSNRTVHVSLKAMKHHSCAINELAVSQDDCTLIYYLIRKRRILHKSLFSERAEEIVCRAKEADKQRIAYALKSGSTKKLVQATNYIPLPLAVNDLDDPVKLVCGPDGVKATTREYFK